MSWFSDSPLRMAFGSTIAAIGLVFTGVGLLINPLIVYAYAKFCNTKFQPSNRKHLNLISIICALGGGALFIMSIRMSPSSREPDAGLAEFLTPLFISFGGIWGYYAEYQRTQESNYYGWIGFLFVAGAFVRLASSN